jgi:hypothetical protein
MEDVRIIQKFTWIPLIVVRICNIQISWLENVKIQQKYCCGKWTNTMIIDEKNRSNISRSRTI